MIKKKRIIIKQMDFSSKETLDSQYFNFSFYLPLPVMKEEDIRLT